MATAERSPTLLVALGLGLLLLWAAAAGWSCAGTTNAQKDENPVPVGSTPVVRQPVAAHVVQNRDILDTSITTAGGLRGHFVPRGALADLRRSKTCVCAQPFCAHPRGRAVQGHEEVMLTAAQQDRYFPAEAGWQCEDMNYAPPPRSTRAPSDIDDPPPSSWGGA